MNARSSTSVFASWQLPTAYSRKRMIDGFELLYRKEGSNSSTRRVTINSAEILTTSVTGLEKYTKYEFQVFAFSSAVEGPKSPVQVARTMEDGKGLTNNIN